MEIRDEFSNLGTMCALVIMLVSHRISILHVYVYFTVLPFGKEIFIGKLSGRFLTTGAPSIRKFSVATESEKSHCTACFIFGVLTLVAAIGSSLILLACTIFLPAVYFLGTGSGDWLQKYATLVISGDHLPAYVASSSFVFMVPSSEPYVAINAHTVLSSE